MSVFGEFLSCDVNNGYGNIWFANSEYDVQLEAVEAWMSDALRFTL
jgi:hypothetical protein